MPSLNDYISAERANRYKAAAMKKRETARVRAAAMQQRAPRFERRVTVRTTFYEPDMTPTTWASRASSCSTAWWRRA